MTTLSPAPQQDMETLISKISHDAHNSVRAVMQLPVWITDDLEERGIDIPDDVLGHFALMAIHARRLDNMVTDLATFARVGQSGGEHVTNLSQCITDIIDALNVPRGFTVTSELACENVQVAQGDMIALLRALLTNGLKHHHLNTGRVHIQTRVTDGACVIVVHDDGPGIAQAEYSRIFDAMTTLRPRDDVEGSGLGLAIVMKVINHYGGSLALGGGADGTGCVFEITLPVGN